MPTQASINVKSLDVQIVVYRPDLALLENLLESFQQQKMPGWTVSLHIFDNSVDEAATEGVRELLTRHANYYRLSPIDFVVSQSNLGFGNGHNRLQARGSGAFILVLNQDVVLEPDSLTVLLAELDRCEPSIAAWEMRQIPYEHPKYYDPATGEASWVSGAAVLFRRTALDEVGGFESRIFLYGEDVDLSWRLRARGWRLRYVARAAVQHLTYSYPEEVKRSQAIGGTLSNLFLRARFGTWSDVSKGVRMLCGEMLIPQAFPGGRRALLLNLIKFAWRLPYFRITKVACSEHFAPEFHGWNYEMRRDGAFHAFTSKRWRPAGAAPEEMPLVSILVRSRDNPQSLRQALSSIHAQTYRPIEVVVVDTGESLGRSAIAEFTDKLNIRYEHVRAMPHAAAGNRALALATGEYMNFVDDNGLLFADHVEVLVEAARKNAVPAAYALAWEADPETLRDGTVHTARWYRTAYRQPFNRVALWHRNYLPIQSVLFHRSLVVACGGFDEQLDGFEDWHLWTRFALAHDFAFVPKTTSVSCNSSDLRRDGARRAQLDAAFKMVRERQMQMRVFTTPFAISTLVEEYVRNESLIHINKSDIRRWVASHHRLRAVASYRGRLVRWARKHWVQ